MTLHEAEMVLEGLLEVRCAVQADGGRCSCPLNVNWGGGRHYAEDVIQVVDRAIRDVQCVEGMDRVDAALQLLREGITGWKPPARQAHREVEWLSACYREVKFQVVREQEVAQ